MTGKPIKILLADDHPVYRHGLREIIGGDPSLTVLKETGDGAEVLPLARKLEPDIALLDMDMPGQHGLDIARARQREGLPFEIIFLTMYREEDIFNEAMDLGARGYVLKESAPADILQAIHSVAAGHHYVSPPLVRLLVGRSSQAADRASAALATLTPAERRVLLLIASDKTSKEIADELRVSPRTVENHRANICAKLGLRGSHSLLKFAFENSGRL